MPHNFPHERLVWINHEHFADCFSAPGREQRLAYAKKKDDKTTTPNVRIFDENELEAQTPWQKALNIQERVGALVPETLVGELEKKAKSGEDLGAYIQDRRDVILTTIYQNDQSKLRDAVKLSKKIDAMSSPQDVRLLIEELLNPEEKPEKNTELQQAIEVHKKPEKETEAQKKSRWEKFLERVSKLTNPLYTRLAGFLKNPSVQKLDTQSPDAIFQQLSTPQKRMTMLRNMADLRHALVLPQNGNANDRKRALEDLFAFLHHAQYLLTSSEKAEFLDFYVRVGTARDIVAAQAKEKNSGEPEEKKAETELQTAERIGTFLADTRGRERKLKGDGSLQDRLQTAANKEKDAFGILAAGLKKDEWIDAMPVSEEVKYTCVLIALEEAAILYREIAAGRMKPKSADDLVTHMKNLMLGAMRRMTREPARETIPFEAEHQHLLEDFRNLQAKVEAAEKPRSSDVNELLLLHAWLEHHGERIDLAEEKKSEYFRKAEQTTEELKADLQSARTQLTTSLKSASVIRSDLLKWATPRLLLEAYRDLEEEKAIEENRQFLAGKSDLPENKRYKIKREPSVLHEECDAEYERQAQEIINGEGTQADKERNLTSLQEKYEKEKELRNHMQEAEIAEWETRLQQALEAEIHFRAAQLQEEYISYVTEQIAKRTGEPFDLDRFMEKIAEKDWGELLEYIQDHELQTILSLDQLKHCSLNGASSITIEVHLDELQARETEVHHPDIADREQKEVRKEAANNASQLLNNSLVEKSVSKETADTLTEIAEGAIPPSGRTSHALRLFNEHPEQFIQTEPDILRLQESRDTIEKRRALHTSLEKQEKDLSKKLETVLPQYLQQNDAYGNRVREKLRSEIRAVHDLLARGNANDTGGNDALAEAENRIGKLQAFFERIDRAYNRIETLRGEDWRTFAQSHDIPDYAWGAYDRADNRIVLNGDKTAYYDAKEAVLTEERRHALNEAIRTFFPMAFGKFFTAFRAQTSEEVRRAFDNAADHWVARDTLEEDVWKDEVIDELFAKYAVYQQYRNELLGKEAIPSHIPLTKRDVALMQQIDPGALAALHFREEAPIEHRRRRAAAASAENEENEEGEDTSEEEAAGNDSAESAEEENNEETPASVQESTEEQATEAKNGYQEGSPNARNITDILNGFIRVDAFFAANPDQKSSDNQAYIEELRTEFDEVYQRYKTDPNSESSEPIKNQVGRIKNDIEDITQKISKYDAEQRDLRHAPYSRNLFMTVWHSIEILSVNDIIAIGKAIYEDVDRQHKRRQQGRIGRVGERLTDWIRDVPGVRRLPYISTLSSEFHRRDKASEVEEVQKWEEALKDDDAYELQEMLATVSNKDQMKAILNQLAERGRIDWSDEHFWRTLNRLSNFSMPIKKCQRDENLREDWLRKIIFDIYNDKDHYRQWKSKNEGGISTEKKNFTPEADRLSNLSGGLAGELEKQLRMFIDAKDKGETIPDDVQPHLYEEIIDYSIRNGKMSMEQKFYYLVMGVSEGLIALDRLRVLAGEGGEILNIFPFIDYFYGKNNTKPEIDALAKRLREDTDKGNDNYYKPGMRTTLWLELEVAREPRVQERLRKGIDRKAGEMDHDDMHFFIPRLDYQTIKSMATPQGGGRQKMTADGWRNAYIGYNGFFKSLGILAELENDKQNAKFSTEDVYQAVRGIAGFIQMDGILTVRSNFGDTEGRRPSISFGEMKNTYAVCTDGKHNVYQDRKSMNEFVRKVLEAYKDERITQDFIDTILYDTEGRGTPEKILQEKIHKNTKLVQDYLELAMKAQGTQKLKDVLRESIPELHAPGSSSAIQDYNYENAQKIWSDFHG